MSTNAQPQRHAITLSTIVLAAAVASMPQSARAMFVAAGCVPGPNHLTSASTSAQVTNAINQAIANPSLLVTADATGMSQTTLGTLGQFSNFVDTDGVFGSFIVTRGIYTGTNATAMATRLDGLLTRTCASATVTVDAAGMTAGAVNVICARIAKVDSVLNLEADKTLVLSAGVLDGKTIAGAGTVSITPEQLAGESSLVNISASTLCFPNASPYFSLAATGRLTIQASRVNGCVIEGSGTVSLTDGVDVPVSISAITANVTFDADGVPGTSVASGATLTLRAAQANGLIVGGAGSTHVSGEIAASTDLTRIASDLVIDGSVAAGANLRLTAQQANGRSIAGAGSVEISASSSSLTDDASFRGISTPDLAFDGSIAAGKTLAINASQQSVIVGGDGTVDVLGTAGDDTLASLSISTKRVLRPGAGNDHLEGGSHVDAAVYAAAIADASFGAPGSSFTVSTASEGADSVSKVELLQFSDATVAVVGHGSLYGSLNDALAQAPAGARIYGALHVDKDSFAGAAGLSALLERVVSGSVLTADLAGMSGEQIGALNASFARFATISGGTITVLRGGSPVAFHVDLASAIALAIDGDTISVGAGDYVLAQQLAISHDITIHGAGSGATRILAGFDTAASGDASALILVGEGRAVSLHGASIAAAGHSVATGILHKGTGSIEQCSFQSIASGADGVAIHARGSVAVRQSQFGGIGRAGVHFDGAGVSAGSFEQSSYAGKGAGSSAEFGVIVSGGAQASISGATISNALAADSAGVLVTDASGAGTRVTVADSAITGNALGIAERGSGAVPAIVSVSGSNLSGNAIALDVSGDAAASCNWWGTADADAIAAQALGHARFSPFSASAAGGCSGEGNVVLEGHGRSYASMSPALAAASAGDRLHAKSASYLDGALVINLADLTVDADAGASGFSLILGTADSVILAGAANIDLTGNARANILTANAGANQIDGAAGHDTAVFAEPFAGISESGGSLTVGSDTVRGVELLQFSDATVAVVGRAGSEIASLNDALALGGHRLYGELLVDRNSFADAGALGAIVGRIVAGSTVRVDVTDMSVAQLSAVAAQLDHVVAAGISGRLEIAAGFDPTAIGQILAKLAPGAVLDVNALGMSAPDLAAVMPFIGRVTSLYNLTVTDLQSEADIAALLAKSVATATDGRALAHAHATGMSAAKLAILAQNTGRIAIDGIGGTVFLPSGASQLSDASLAALLSRVSPAAHARVEGAGLSSSTLAVLHANIGLIDSIYGLALTSASTEVELVNLLSRSDDASASVLATGMSPAQLAVVADHAAKLVSGGLSGGLVLDQQLSGAQIAALLAKADWAATTVTVDATGMGVAHLAPIADAAGAHAGAVTIANATLRAGLSLAQMTAILGASLPNSVTVLATGMTAAQLELVFGGSPAIRQVGGTIAINASTTLAQIQAFIARAGSTLVLDIDRRGMSAEQLSIIGAIPMMSVEADAILHTGDEFVVDVDVHNLARNAMGLQAKVVYDASKLEYIGGYDIGGAAFPMLIWSDLRVGMLHFSTGVDFTNEASAQGVTDGNGARLRFRSIVPFCVVSDAVSLSAEGFSNRIASNTAEPIDFTGANAGLYGALDNLQMTGVSDFAVSVATDAGSVLGAAYPEPVVSASNSCGPIQVVRTITLPNGSLASQWPTHFPFDADPSQDRPTVVTWTVSDETGASITHTHSYTVAKYQLAEIDVNLVGSIAADFTHGVTLRLDTGDVVTAPVHFTGGDGAVIDARIPIRPAFSCVQIQDVGRTLAASRPLAMVGRKYVAEGSFSLMGGDSNGDNKIDVLDFGMLVTDFGFGKTPASRSNYDRDNRVGNGDFAFIGINFLRTGERCTAGFDGEQPITRISVKELRRRGMGELAAADLNGDGWLDSADIAIAMQGGLARPEASK